MLQIVRCLFDELACFLHQRRNRRRHSTGKDTEHHHDHQADRGRPGGKAPPAKDRVGPTQR